MDLNVFLLLIFFTISFLLYSNAIMAQQNFSGKSIFTCMNNDTTGPSPAFLYTCNGLHKFCQTFLIFESQPPYTTVAAISNLTSSNPRDLARINDASMSKVFQTGQEVIVPVNCSCPTREYYQANSTYVLQPSPTYYRTAFDIYQGLSTCDSLIRANSYGIYDLLPGMVLNVTLRCACPTEQQTMNGIKYLLTYRVNSGDNITNIAARFNVTAGSLLDANGLPYENHPLFPLTTVLIPLPNEPNISMTIVHNVPPSQPTSPPVVYPAKKNKTKRKFIVAVATSGGFILLVLFVIFSAVFVLRKRPKRISTKGTKSRSKRTTNIRGEIASFDHGKVYMFEEIKEATENFSPKNRIKGSVYRGVFENGSEILAVKQMSADASKEVNLLAKINHFNLIKLQGYCKNDSLFYLVFEYMEHGSLREWLGRNRSIEHQSLANRIQIALDIANGLQYLHNFTEPCYVHKGINTDNILLNRNLRAKIANLTLAEESEGGDEILCRYSTLHVGGTKGYMAPEYLEAGIVTSKMDVYAFGVVLLELITGKDSIVEEDGRELMLSSIIIDLIDKDDAEERLILFIDPSLNGNSEKLFAIQLFKLSLACLIEEPAKRPNMAEVVSSLLRIHTEMEKRISPIIDNIAYLER
ncbi:hypothetical protein RIF29_12780 [Crotalaria pallida]|uniref:LysM domain receptor-like kinase 4 n=1 Tax=Crotalaria pallida TaxID=3830 RepID=A0AAN9INJ4_CROPI